MIAPAPMRTDGRYSAPVAQHIRYVPAHDARTDVAAGMCRQTHARALAAPAYGLLYLSFDGARLLWRNGDRQAVTFDGRTLRNHTDHAVRVWGVGCAA